MSQVLERLDDVLMKIFESQLSISDDNYVNPFARYMQPNGEVWLPVGGGFGGVANAMFTDEKVYSDQATLELVRSECRFLANKNPFAICGHESRRNYVVGWGFVYTVSAKDKNGGDEAMVEKAKKVVDDFCKRIHWGQLESDLLYFRDRDGATLLRYHQAVTGEWTVRRLEIDQLKAPHDSKDAFGIKRNEVDFDTIEGYWIDGEYIEASEVQLRTRKACRVHQLGVPLFYGGKSHLHAAVKILRNIAALTNIQSAIGAIRKFVGAAASTVKTAVKAGANASKSSNAPGFGNGQSNERLGQEMPPGTVINTNDQVDWQFPTMGNDPTKHIPPVQAELRAAGASASMPEYMFTGDASNANFASTQVAKDPAMKSFLKVQFEEVEYNREVIERLLVHSLGDEILDIIEVQVEPPPLDTENRKEKAEVDKILLDMRVKSPQEISAEHGLDYEQQQEYFELHEERTGIPLSGERPPLDDQQLSDLVGGAQPGTEGEPQPVQLNGAQIQAAIEVIGQYQQGIIPQQTATQLLLSLGVDAPSVKLMLAKVVVQKVSSEPRQSSVALPPAQPPKADAQGASVDQG